MLNPINNINFKAIYTPKFTKFSESQQKVYNDIKSKLDKENKDSDFYIKPSKDDSLELSTVYGIKETGYGLNKKYTYLKKNVIGRYDENHLFDIKDYKDYCKKETKDTLSYISIALIPIILLYGAFFLITNKKNIPTEQTEKVITVAKDSLQTIKQDSLNFAKESSRVLK